MIKSDMGKVELRGVKPQLMVETECIIHSMKKKGIVNDREIDMICRNAKKTEEEMLKEMEDPAKMVTRVMKEIFGKSVDIFGTDGEEEDEKEEPSKEEKNDIPDSVLDKIADIVIKKMKAGE